MVNDKDRKTQCVMTEGSIVFKIPLGPEKEKLGHFIESQIVDGHVVFRFATKKQTDTPALFIEHRPEFEVSFH